MDLAIKDTKKQGNALVWAIYYNRPVDLIKRMLDKEPKLLDEYMNKESFLYEALNMKIDDKESVAARKNKEAIIEELIKHKPAIKEPVECEPAAIVRSEENDNKLQVATSDTTLIGGINSCSRGLWYCVWC